MPLAELLSKWVLEKAGLYLELTLNVATSLNVYCLVGLYRLSVIAKNVFIG